jgi:hypothetical protein
VLLHPDHGTGLTKSVLLDCFQLRSLSAVRLPDSFLFAALKQSVGKRNYKDTFGFPKKTDQERGVWCRRTGPIRHLAGDALRFREVQKFTR